MKRTVTRKRAPCTSKRALHTFERATHKSAKCFRISPQNTMKSTITLSRALNTYTCMYIYMFIYIYTHMHVFNKHYKKHCIHAKEPRVHSKEPYIHSKEPYKHSKNPCMQQEASPCKLANRVYSVYTQQSPMNTWKSRGPLLRKSLGTLLWEYFSFQTLRALTIIVSTENATPQKSSKSKHSN